MVVAAIIWSAVMTQSIANAKNAWVRIPTGSYKPLFARSEANPKGLYFLKENLFGKKEDVRIEVAEFEVQVNPVSNQEFLNFVKRNSEWRRDKVKPIFANQGYLDHWQGPVNAGKHVGDPVVSISWFAANAYCEYVGARLPTTDEWEYIASQDDAAKRDEAILKWYSQPNNGPDQKVSKDHFVGKYGIRDMHGRIWEWTLDFNSSFVTGESREDSSLSRSLFCGAGSIGATDPKEYATFMRFAFRSSLKGNYALPALGFRCARSVRSS